MSINILIDKLISRRSLLSHPFYQSWSAGKLGIETLKEYAKQYYKLEAAFPTFLSAIHSRCGGDRSVRQLITENLADEELGSENHAELWLRFCEGLGLKRKDVLGAKALPETKRTIENFRRLASSGHVVEGIAAMYTYESQIPDVAKTKRDGLKKFYGIASRRAVKFFTVHEKADVWHSQVERGIMKKYAKNKKIEKRIIVAVKKARDSLWLFLDGVHRAYC